MPVRNPIVCLICVRAFVPDSGEGSVRSSNLDGLVYFGEHFRHRNGADAHWHAEPVLVGIGVFHPVIQRLRGVYFKGLAMFTMRQIAAKVNTAFVSLWAVTVLLFFSIVVFSTGFSLATVFSDQLEENHSVRCIHPREPDVT